VRLSDPNDDRPAALAFTPDGARLVAADARARLCHVWDLRALRAGLKAVGLDWDAPPFPPPPAGDAPPAVEVITDR